MGQDNQMLFELFKISVDTENNIRKTIRDTMNYYSAFMVSIIGGILLVATNSSDMFFRYLGLLLGGIILCCISYIAFAHYKSDYRRQVEQIAIQAKLEDLLGLTNSETYPLMSYWDSEPIVPLVYLKTRKSCKSSDEFINWFMKNTDIKIIKGYYIIFSIIGMSFICYSLFNIF